MSALVRIERLVKQYGGLIATREVSLELHHGQVHALIGPNGAGKTTLIHQLSGVVRPDSGRILIGGRDVTRTSVSDRARSGLARSFQITSLFGEFTVLDNVATAVQAAQGHSFRFWRDVRRDARVIDPAMAILERLQLAKRADTEARNLSYGEQRQLELAMALATQPKLLLLDEPTELAPPAWTEWRLG